MLLTFFEKILLPVFVAYHLAKTGKIKTIDQLFFS